MREGHLVWRAWLKQMWSPLKLKLYRSMKVLDADISHMIFSLVFDKVENTIKISCDLGLFWLFISLILTIDKNIPPSKFQEPLDINFRSQFCLIIHTWDVPTVVWLWNIWGPNLFGLDCWCDGQYFSSSNLPTRSISRLWTMGRAANGPSWPGLGQSKSFSQHMRAGLRRAKALMSLGWARVQGMKRIKFIFNQ